MSTLAIHGGKPAVPEGWTVVEASRAAGVRTDLTMEVGELPDAMARTVHRVDRVVDQVRPHLI